MVNYTMKLKLGDNSDIYRKTAEIFGYLEKQTNLDHK